MLDSSEQPKGADDARQRVREQLLFQQKVKENQRVAAEIADLRERVKRGDNNARKELGKIRDYLYKQTAPPVGIRNFTEIEIAPAEVRDTANRAQRFLRDNIIGNVLSNGFEMIPVVGNIKKFGDFLIGTDFLTGQRLDWYQRTFALIGSAIPWVPGRALRDTADAVRYGIADLFAGKKSRGAASLIKAGAAIGAAGVIAKRGPIIEGVRQVRDRVRPPVRRA